MIATIAGAAITIGASLYTLHYPSEPFAEAARLSNHTPGLYVRTDDWVIGGVRNSFGRPSYYAAMNWPVDTRFGRLDFSVGAITGYQYRTVTGPTACPRDWGKPPPGCEYRCSAYIGATGAVLRPLVTVSYVVPADFAGIKPRITLLGKGLHFSLEKEL